MGMKKRFAWTCLLAIILAAAIRGAAWAAEEQEAVSPVAMEISLLYGQRGKLGSYIPVSVRLYGQSAAHFEGTVWFGTLESGGDDKEERYEYGYPVEVRPAETKEYPFYIPLGQKSSELHVILESQAGETVARETLHFDISRDQGRLLIGLLDDEPQRVGYLDSVNMNYGMVTSELIAMEDSTFPEDIRGLDLLDILVVNHYDTSRLSGEQQAAVRQWVHNGGILLLGTGEWAPETLGGFDPALTDGEPEILGLESVSMGAEYARRSPEDSVVEMVCADLSSVKGRTLIESDGLTLLVEVSEGEGAIDIFSYDLGDLGEFAAGNPGYAVRLFSAILGESALQELYFYSAYDKDTDYWNAQSLVSTGSTDRLPDPVLYGLVAAVYIAAAGPGAYLILKKRDMGIYYGVSVALLSAVFSVIIYMIGVRTRFTSEFFTYVSLRDVSDGAEEELTYLNIRTPDSRAYSVQLDPAYEVTPLTRSSRYDEVSVRAFSDGRDGNVSLRYSEEGTTIQARRSRAFASRFFRLEKKEDLSASGWFAADIRYFDGKISGYIMNCFPFALENTALITYGQTLPIGRMEAGEVREFEDVPLLTWPVDMAYLLANRLAGSARAEESESRQYLQTVERANVYSFYVNRYFGEYTPDIRISGFGPAVGADGAVLPEGKTVDGLTLYTCCTEAVQEQDGLIYRSGLMQRPEVASGNGSSYQTMMTLYGPDPVAVEYALGNDLEIERLSFLPVSDEFFDDSRYPYLKQFEGTIWFYNYDTKTYDPVEPAMSGTDGEVLASYLSPENHLIVKYAVQAGDTPGFNYALPLVMVQGRKR